MGHWFANLDITFFDSPATASWLAGAIASAA
jgi:hypothetical protein